MGTRIPENGRRKTGWPRGFADLTGCVMRLCAGARHLAASSGEKRNPTHPHRNAGNFEGPTVTQEYPMKEMAGPALVQIDLIIEPMQTAF